MLWFQRDHFQHFTLDHLIHLIRSLAILQTAVNLHSFYVFLPNLIITILAELIYLQLWCHCGKGTEWIQSIYAAYLLGHKNGYTLIWTKVMRYFLDTSKKGAFSLSVSFTLITAIKEFSVPPPKMNHKAFNISFDAVDRDFETLRETSFRKKSTLQKIKYKNRKKLTFQVTSLATGSNLTQISPYH